MLVLVRNHGSQHPPSKSRKPAHRRVFCDGNNEWQNSDEKSNCGEINSTQKLKRFKSNVFCLDRKITEFWLHS